MRNSYTRIMGSMQLASGRKVETDTLIPHLEEEVFVGGDKYQVLGCEVSPVGKTLLIQKVDDPSAIRTMSEEEFEYHLRKPVDMEIAHGRIILGSLVVAGLVYGAITMTASATQTPRRPFLVKPDKPLPHAFKTTETTDK